MFYLYKNMLFDEYYQKQLEIQRELNKNIVNKFKEIEVIIKDNNNCINDKIEKQNIEINYLKSKFEVIRELSLEQQQIDSYNPIKYITIHLFYGVVLYEGIYYLSKLFFMNGI